MGSVFAEELYIKGQQPQVGSFSEPMAFTNISSTELPKREEPQEFDPNGKAVLQLHES